MDLHADRVRLSDAIPIAAGVVAALSPGSLSRDWFDAMARTEEEVDKLMERVNDKRREAAARAKAK